MYPKIIQVLFHIKIMMKTYSWDWKDFIFTGWDSRIPFLRGQMNFFFDQRIFPCFFFRLNFWVARIYFCLIPFAIDWYFIFYDEIPRLLIFFPINMWYQFLSLHSSTQIESAISWHVDFICKYFRKGDLLEMFAKILQTKINSLFDVTVRCF